VGRLFARTNSIWPARCRYAALDLFGDYKSNVGATTRPSRNISGLTSRRSPCGAERSVLPPAGAEAFKRDIPGAVVRFFDTVISRWRRMRPKSRRRYAIFCLADSQPGLPRYRPANHSFGRRPARALGRPSRGGRYVPSTRATHL